MVARQPFRMMLPISARASCSSSMISSRLQLAADDGPHQLEALGVREDQQRPAGDVALEHLVDAHEMADLVLAQGPDRRVAAHQVDPGHRQQHLLADHVAQAGGSTADADIDHLGQGVDLELVEKLAHRGASRSAASSRNSPIALSVSGFCRNVAPTSRARVTTSTWWLAEMTASGSVGLEPAQLGREMKAVAARHVEVEDGEVERILRSERESLVGVGGLDAGPVGMQGRQSLGDGHPRKLAVVDDQNPVTHISWLPMIQQMRHVSVR